MDFLNEFLRNPVLTGAVAPSSKAMAELITDTAALENKKCVVEFGSGDGVFTEKILAKINTDCTSFAIEINEKFVRETQNRCPNATVYQDSAENIQKYLAKHNEQHCDCIISALPWSVFDLELQHKLLDAAYHALNKGGVFLTVGYNQGLLLPNGRKFRKMLNDKFESVTKTKVIWGNIPPGFVYNCTK